MICTAPDFPDLLHISGGHDIIHDFHTGHIFRLQADFSLETVCHLALRHGLHIIAAVEDSTSLVNRLRDFSVGHCSLCA